MIEDGDFQFQVTGKIGSNHRLSKTRIEADCCGAP